jgi:hypothetical protein
MSNDMQKSQQGSGSAENQGGKREEQFNQTAHLGEKEKRDMEEQAGLGRDRITTLEETGALSGADDNSGGSGDNMSGQDTGEETER